MYVDRDPAARTGPAARVELEDGGDPRFVRLLEGPMPDELDAAGGASPGVKHVA